MSINFTGDLVLYSGNPKEKIVNGVKEIYTPTLVHQGHYPSLLGDKLALNLDYKDLRNRDWRTCLIYSFDAQSMSVSKEILKYSLRDGIRAIFVLDALYFLEVLEGRSSYKKEDSQRIEFDDLHGALRTAKERRPTGRILAGLAHARINLNDILNQSIPIDLDEKADLVLKRMPQVQLSP